jgi:D-tyrosyl-tRNA(Tyr) deacylase
MRVVAQRVKSASVEVDRTITGRIDAGLLILLGISRTDTEADAEYLAEKMAGLRIFQDEAGKMNRSVLDAGGAMLVVSQFTLYGDIRRGKRPSFDQAAAPDKARVLYEYFVEAACRRGVRVETGVFQATMQVHLVNDGPVTIFCDSSEKFGQKPEAKPAN